MTNIMIVKLYCASLFSNLEVFHKDDQQCSWSILPSVLNLAIVLPMLIMISIIIFLLTVFIKYT